MQEYKESPLDGAAVCVGTEDDGQTVYVVDCQLCGFIVDTMDDRPTAVRIAYDHNILTHPALPFPDDLTCPRCGEGGFQHVETVPVTRAVIGWTEDGSLDIEAVVTDAIWEDPSADAWIECSGCLQRFTVPERHDFVEPY